MLIFLSKFAAQSDFNFRCFSNLDCQLIFVLGFLGSRVKNKQIEKNHLEIKIDFYCTANDFYCTANDFGIFNLSV